MKRATSKDLVAATTQKKSRGESVEDDDGFFFFEEEEEQSVPPAVPLHPPTSASPVTTTLAALPLRRAESFFKIDGGAPGFFHAEHSQSGREHKLVLFMTGGSGSGGGGSPTGSSSSSSRKQPKRPAGKILFTQRSAEAGTIDHVWVRDRHRGLGLGRVLLRCAMEVCGAGGLGMRRLTLDAEEDTRRHNRVSCFEQ